MVRKKLARSQSRGLLSPQSPLRSHSNKQPCPSLTGSVGCLHESERPSAIMIRNLAPKGSLRDVIQKQKNPKVCHVLRSASTWDPAASHVSPRRVYPRPQGELFPKVCRQPVKAHGTPPDATFFEADSRGEEEHRACLGNRRLNGRRWHCRSSRPPNTLFSIAPRGLEIPQRPRHPLWPPPHGQCPRHERAPLPTQRH